MPQRQLIRVLWVLALVFSILLAAANIRYGDLNQDEGWYLYAARLVSQGEHPYLDFAFMQPPLLPYVYGTIGRPMLDSMGVVGGRIFTAILGLASALVAAFIAFRLSSVKRRSWAAALAFILCGINVYQSYYTTMVKTYALCGLLLALGFLVLTFMHGRRSSLYAALGGVCIALAAGARVSTVFVLPAVFAILLWRRHAREAVAFTLGALIAGCGVFLPFVIGATESFMYCVVKYHTAREVGDVMAQLVYKAGFVSRVVRGYFVAIGLSVAVGLFAIRHRLFRGEGGADAGGDKVDVPAATRTVVPSLWVGVLLVSLIHLTAHFPYDDYQVVLLPMFAAAVAVTAAGLPVQQREVGWLVTVTFLLSIAAACSSSINQEWFIGGRDRIWWRTKDQPSLAKLQDAARKVKDLAGDTGEILTQDTYLAFEAGLRVPRGLEMGPFSYFPGLETAVAERLHVLNEERMLDLLKTSDAQVAAFSGYGLAIACPGVEELQAEERRALWAAVLDRYEEECRVEQFGQGLTTLTIYVKK